MRTISKIIILASAFAFAVTGLVEFAVTLADEAPLIKADDKPYKRRFAGYDLRQP